MFSIKLLFKATHAQQFGSHCTAEANVNKTVKIQKF